MNPVSFLPLPLLLVTGPEGGRVGIVVDKMTAGAAALQSANDGGSCLVLSTC